MTNRAKLAGATSIFAALLAGSVAAQGVKIDDGGATVDTPSVTDNATDMAQSDTGAGVSGNAGASGKTTTMAKELNYGQLVSSYRTGANFAAEVEGIGTDTEVSTVTLSELEGQGDANGQGLDEAMASNQDAIDALRSAIQANADLSGKLDAEGYAAEDVVAVHTDADGKVWVVVDDTM